MWKDVDNKKWIRFVREGMDYDDESEYNIKHDFKKSCKQFGPAYFRYLTIAYTICRMEGLMDDDEFVRINRVDPNFFVKNREKMYQPSAF